MLLRQGVESYAPYLQSSGELFDPVFGEPTQYGTPCHAYCNAVLAAHATAPERVRFAERALRGLQRSLGHLLDLSEPPAGSGFRRDTGAITRVSHRDFFWPPVLKTFQLLCTIPETASAAATLTASIQRVDVTSAFRSRPPSNWAAVWLLGEWLRTRNGQSSTTQTQIDHWLSEFFEQRILLQQGFYQEPGHPNSYDLFTRIHLLELLSNGYDGAALDRLEALLARGLARSLAMQLSDGSLASAHRSTGQTWTVAAQCAYFTIAAILLAAAAPNHADRARAAAIRAFRSLRRWQRHDAPFSPVENCLPPAVRTGYEAYTADGHYGNLALAFLATAIQYGFTATEDALPEREASALAEGDPVYRAIAHCGDYSLHLNAFPASHYDAFGIVDLTVGVDRTLQFASTVHHLQSGQPFNLGLATRETPGRSELAVLAQRDHALLGPISATVQGSSATLALEGRAKGVPSTYRITAHITASGITIAESTPGLTGPKTLLIPYLVDAGRGVQTQATWEPQHITLQHGSERVTITLDGPIEHILHFPGGYENRRGTCGLLRVDLDGVCEQVSYHVAAG